MKFSKHHLVVSGHVGGWLGSGRGPACIFRVTSHCTASRPPAGAISTRLMVNRPKERDPGNHNIMTSVSVVVSCHQMCLSNQCNWIVIIMKNEKIF